MRIFVILSMSFAACGPVRPAGVDHADVSQNRDVLEPVLLLEDEIEPDACLTVGRPEGDFGSLIVETDHLLPPQESFYCGVADDVPGQARCRFDVVDGADSVSICNGSQFDHFRVTWHPAVHVLDATLIDETFVRYELSFGQPVHTAWVEGNAAFTFSNDEQGVFHEATLGSSLWMEAGTTIVDVEAIEDENGDRTPIGDIDLVHFDLSPLVVPVEDVEPEVGIDDAIVLHPSGDISPAIHYGFLEEDAVDVYILPLHGGSWTLLSTGDLDTVGEIVDGNGNSLHSNDDGGEGLNFEITFDAPEEESVYLLVQGYDSLETGDYAVELWSAGND